MKWGAVSFVVFGLVACTFGCLDLPTCKSCRFAGCYYLKMMNGSTICSPTRNPSGIRYRIDHCEPSSPPQPEKSLPPAAETQLPNSTHLTPELNPNQLPTVRPRDEKMITEPEANLDFLTGLNGTQRIRRTLCRSLILTSRLQRQPGADTTTIRNYEGLNPMIRKAVECEMLINERRKQRKLECSSCPKAQSLILEDTCKNCQDCKTCTSQTQISCNWTWNGTLTACIPTSQHIPDYWNFIGPDDSELCPTEQKNPTNGWMVACIILLCGVAVGTGGLLGIKFLRRRREPPAPAEIPLLGLL